MMSYLMGGMILIAVVGGWIGGNMAEVSTAAMSGCGQAVQLAFSLAGTLCLWSGVMSVAEKSGLTALLCRAFRPLNRLLFRELDPEGPAARAISMNLAANLLGLGNAATPLGLAALGELDRQNPRPAAASRAMGSRLEWFGGDGFGPAGPREALAMNLLLEGCRLLLLLPLGVGAAAWFDALARG